MPPTEINLQEALWQLFGSGNEAIYQNWRTSGGSIADLGSGGGSGGYGVNVRSYGAMGDFTTDDTAAIQAAINAAAANSLGPGGGVVFVPAGYYTVSGQLQIPYNKTIQLRGEGDMSVIRWPTSLGPGVHCIDYVGSWGANRQVIADLKLVGPQQGGTRGTPNTDMYGIRVRNNITLERVLVSGFYCGAEITGNHNRLYNSAFGSGFYGLYWGPNHESRGDVIVRDCNLEGNLMASVGVHPANALDGCSFIATHFGAGPYCFHTPNGTIVFVHAAFATNFDNCSFEGYGNGFWRDDQGTRQMYGLQFINCGATTPFAADQRIAGQPADYHVTGAGRFEFYCRATNVSGSLFEGPGAVGWFNVPTLNFVYDGADQLVNLAASTDKPINVAAVGDNTVRWQNGKSEGRFAIINGGTAAVTGDVIRLYGGGWNVTPINTVQAVQGIALQDRASETPVLIQYRGACSVKTSGSVSAGNPMKASGTGTTMQSATDWGDAVLGSAKNATSGGFTDTQLRLGL